MQVVRLSREHALYSALAYLLTQALGDYTAPLAEMVWALAHLAQVLACFPCRAHGMLPGEQAALA